MYTLLPTRKQNYNIMFIYKNKARDRLLRLFIARDAQQTVHTEAVENGRLAEVDVQGRALVMGPTKDGQD